MPPYPDPYYPPKQPAAKPQSSLEGQELQVISGVICITITVCCMLIYSGYKPLAAGVVVLAMLALYYVGQYFDHKVPKSKR